MNPSTRFLLALAGLAAATACAAMTAADCQDADWYQVGFRDAIFGLQPQDGSYAPQCERHGAKVDLARYSQGWREGKYEFDNRMRKE